jgi:hypothetical protein
MVTVPSVFQAAGSGMAQVIGDIRCVTPQL